MLIGDFADKAKIQYGAVHLCFTGHVNQDEMRSIAG